jgi:Family of unknown function (DUF6600)
MVQTITSHHMKKTISIKFPFSPAILAWALMGGFSVQDSSAQTQPAPPPNADLVSAAPDNASTASTLPPDIDPDSPLAQVVRLVQAGVEQGVILSYIGNSMNPFNLNADQIIYLNDLGVPTEIVNAMQQRDQQLQQMGVTTGAAATPPPETTETTPPQPTEVTVNYFYDTLAPYGGWVNFEGYGWCWRPTIVVYNTGWQPYCDNGHWVYTDSGWYWVSGYSWGWATFHYGRWFHHQRYGWCWRPDTTWAPSWVLWRHDRDYCGWAPLPPSAVYRSGVGFVYQGHAAGAGLDLDANAFTFVATKNFCDPHPRRHRIRAGEVTRIFNQTTVINNITFDSHHQGIVNAGIPPHDITAVTRREIHPVTIQARNGSVAWGGRHEQFEHNGNTLVVNRPHFVGTPVLSVHQGTSPATKPGQNTFQPVVHGNPNNAPAHPATPGQNNSPQRNINQNPYQNVNRTPPRMPQTQQPVVPHVNTPNPQAPNKVVPTPPGNHSGWPAQNQKSNYNYNNSGNRVLTPRAQGSEQQSPHGNPYSTQSHGNTAVPQSSSGSSTANHYSPPVGQPQNNGAPPPDESRYHNQNSNHSDAHSEPSRQVVQPHPSPQSSASSSPSSGKPAQNQNKGRGGH